MKTTLNFGLTLILVNYFLWLIVRVIGERLPINSKQLILLFLFFSLGTKFFFFLRTWLVTNKPLWAKQNSEEGVLAKLAKKGVKWLEISETYLHLEFIRGFLGKSPQVSTFFFFCLKICEKMDNNNSTQKIILIFWVSPWILAMTSLGMELFSGDTLLITLYWFSLGFLIKQIMKFWCEICKNYIQLIININLAKYLSIFFEDLTSCGFFITNCKIREEIFFKTLEMQNKTMLKFFWRFCTELLYWVVLKKTLEITFIRVGHLAKFLLDIQILVYVLAICLISKVLSDFFVCLIFFLFIFFCFLICLNHLSLDVEFRTSFLSSIEYKTLYEKELREIKKRLLATYQFLKENDLPDFFDDLSPRSWNNIFFLFFKQFSWKNLLSKEDFVVWETIINQKFQWYKDKRDLGLIDLTTFKIIENSEKNNKKTKHD